MKIVVSSILGIIVSIQLIAQVPKKVVVEHFTNTRCSICASRNPGFYTNLGNHAAILHLSIHPSSPYSNCILNNHNPVENDNRTKYYGQYGSTPKFTIQGSNIPSSQNVSNPSLFTPFTGQTSAASITMSHKKYGLDSIQARIVITTMTAHTLPSLKLFAVLVEDTVAYNAPNGEKEHYDVFRKALSDIEGDKLTLPSTVGDSLVFAYSAPYNFDWTFKRIYVMAILQEEVSKEVVQSEVTFSENTGSPVGVLELHNSDFEIFPNPVSDILTIKSKAPIEHIRLFNVLGELEMEMTDLISGLVQIDVMNKKSGLYFIEITSGGKSTTRKILIK